MWQAPLIFLSSLLLMANGVASASDFYINCGGPMLYRDSLGNVWVGDDYPTGNYSYYNTGRTKSTIANVSGTDDPELYETERWDGRSGVEMTYEIPLEENGTYDVLLHFAEVFRKAQAPNKRRFNVFIERTLVLEEYDMYELYGGYTAIIESFSTTVDDGALTIDFVRGSVQNPKINAIEIHPAAPSSAPSVSNAPSVSAAPTVSTSPSSSPTTSAAPSMTAMPSVGPSSTPSLRPSASPTKSPTQTTTTTEEATTTAEEATTTTKEATTTAEEATTPEEPDEMTTEEPDETTTEKATTEQATTTAEVTTTTEAATTTPPAPATTTPPAPATEPTVWEMAGGEIFWRGSDQALLEDNVLSMSLNGEVVAIGQPQDDTTNKFTGRVSLFKYNEFFGWTPLGDAIDRRTEQDAALFGYSVSMDEDGKVVAIGDPGDEFTGSKGRAFVYYLEDNEWKLKGQIISPADEGEDDVYAGRTVSLSADGNTVAVVLQIKARTPGPPTFVRVYQYDESDEVWRALGQGIFGRLATVNDPFSIDLCKDGTTLSISSLVPGTGYVESYKYNATSGMWEIMGDAIESKSDQEAVGISVSMSSDGSIVAFGTRLFESSNLVRVYKFVDGEWEQVGEDINTGGEPNARRLTLSVNSDGSRVAIGPQDRTPTSSVYEWNGRKWKQVGQSIESYELRPAGLQLQSIALSSEGDRVAVFSPGGQSVTVYDEARLPPML